MSYSLNSKAVIYGIFLATTIGVSEEDTRSLIIISTNISMIKMMIIANIPVI